jgi:hypothetical protein
MSDPNSVVAVYDTHEQAELAIRELQEVGADMTLTDLPTTLTRQRTSLRKRSIASTPFTPSAF